MDDLQRLLGKGEYAPFTSPPILESKFVQINRRGDPVSVHNRPCCVTIAICAANPNLPMPDTMLIACETSVSPQESMANLWKLSEEPSHIEELILTRLFPLKFVELSVHSTEMHHFMLRLVNGRCYYLELCAPPDKKEQLFHMWLQLLSHLNPPENTQVDSSTKANIFLPTAGRRQAGSFKLGLWLQQQYENGDDEEGGEERGCGGMESPGQEAGAGATARS
ncbi:PREDICTED: protein FAM71D-like, partial [Merops nubicus]|uniref:protein FAM71D-like n=1 Tax=Merops nubicus TaxID=57421 RepID=UPI0004F0A8C0